MPIRHALATQTCVANHKLCRLRRLAFIGLVIVLATSAQVRAAEVCIFSGNTAALSFWLENYQDNGQDDIIRLVSGTMDVPAGGFVFESTEAHSLSLSGGWNDSCSGTRSEDATVIDGGGTQPLMRILNPNGIVTVRRITWVDGYKLNVGAGAAGLQINGIAGTGGDVTVELNQFVANENAAGGSIGGGAGLYATTQNGHLQIRNNLFVANAGGTGSAAHLAVTGTGVGYIVNNTVAANGRAGDNIGGVYLVATGSSPADAFIASNNILWANVGNDLRIPTNTLLYNNDIEDRLGIANPGSTNNFNVDPLFAGGSFVSLRLSGNSPMINAGFPNPYGGLTSVDLDGNTRIQNGIVDIGAYEYPDRIFADDFD